MCQGFQVTGLFMQNWDIRNEVGACSGEQDREDAHWVCSKLGIPLKEVNFVKEYWNDVFRFEIIKYFLNWKKIVIKIILFKVFISEIIFYDVS